MRYIPDAVVYFTILITTICFVVCGLYFSSNKTFGIWSLFIGIVFGLCTVFLYWQNDIWKNQDSKVLQSQHAGKNTTDKPVHISTPSQTESPTINRAEIKRPRIWLKSIVLLNLEVDKLPMVQFEFQNSRDADAFDVTIETGIHATPDKLVSDPPPILFKSDPSKTFLPKGEVMHKTLPFGRAVTADEIVQINNGTLYIYAYSVLHYTGDTKVYPIKEHTLRFCALYNPKTTYFQNTPFFNQID